MILLKDLIKKKFPFQFKYYHKSPGLLLSDRYRLDHNLRSIISTSTINKYNALNPYVISDKVRFDKNNFFKIFNIKKLNVNFLNSKILHIYILPKILINFILFYFKSIFKKDKIEWLIREYKCENINIGDLIYDMYIRYELKFIKPNIYSLDFIKHLMNGIYKIFVIKYYIQKYNVKCIISNQKGYISYGNLLLRYGLKKKILTILNGYNFIKIYKNYNETMSSPFKIEARLLNKFKVSKSKILQFYKDRTNFKTHGSYVPIATLEKVYGKRKNRKFKELMKNKKKYFKFINIFALHCFSDAPHTSELVFKDHYDQFIETIKFLKENNPQSLWIIKPHPGRGDYGEKGLVEEKIKLLNSENILVCPENVNNLELFNYASNLVTGISTISLEFACYGKKSIIAGEAPFYQEKLFLKPKNKDEYFKMIEGIENFDVNLNYEEILLSKKILFLLENSMNVNLSQSTLLPDFRLKRFQSDEGYIKKLKHNLLNNKINTIYDDPMYKDIKNILRKIKFPNKNLV